MAARRWCPGILSISLPEESLMYIVTISVEAGEHCRRRGDTRQVIKAGRPEDVALAMINAVEKLVPLFLKDQAGNVDYLTINVTCTPPMAGGQLSREWSKVIEQLAEIVAITPEDCAVRVVDDSFLPLLEVPIDDQAGAADVARGPSVRSQKGGE
jgi:hypothetical protein